MSQKKKSKRLLERYMILVNARNFHYENFNKWLTYFYVANGALFIGYVQLLTFNKDSDSPLITYPVLILGFCAGLMLYWSSKGYYYWNINFIMLVNHYEEKLLNWNKEERVYSMFANKTTQNNYFKPYSGANFSTSKIAILFGGIVAFSWGCLLFYYLSGLYCEDKLWRVILSIAHSVIVILLSSIPFKKTREGYNLHLLGSNTDPLEDLKIKQKGKE